MTYNTTNVADHPQITKQAVIIGLLVGFDADNKPLVAFPGNPEAASVPALYTSSLNQDDIGRQVALLFVNGDLRQPMIVGPVRESLRDINANSTTLIIVDEEDSLTLTAKHRVTIKCGDSSITLTKDGKVLIRGKYISSRASCMQTIKGGSVNIN